MAETVSRLFFALWPKPAIAQRVYRHVCGLISTSLGRDVAADQLHITLAYLGHQSLAQQHCAMAVASDICFRPFTLTLDQLGHFAQARVVWLGARYIPPELRDIQAKLVTQLKSQCGYQPESRPFVPHVTLRRKVSQFTGSDSPVSIDWRVNRFVLARSESSISGARYSVIHSWPSQA